MKFDHVDLVIAGIYLGGFLGFGKILYDMKRLEHTVDPLIHQVYARAAGEDGLLDSKESVDLLRSLTISNALTFNESLQIESTSRGEPFVLIYAAREGNAVRLLDKISPSRLEDYLSSSSVKKSTNPTLR